MQKNPDERLFYIDLAESLAIFFVIIYHCTNYSFDNISPDESTYGFYFRYFLRTILSCCVPLFFLANGYLLLNRTLNLKKHLKKIVRLTVLTVVWEIITIVALMFVKNEFLNFRSFMTVFWDFRIDWNNHLWFMHTLIIIYLFFPLLKLAYDKRLDIFYFFTIAVALFTFGIPAINLALSIAYQNSSFNDWFEDFKHCKHIYWHAVVYFCLGGCIYQLRDKLKFLNKTPINVLIILLSMLGLFAIGVAMSDVKHQQWDVVWNGYDTVFTLINVVCIFFLCFKYQGKDNLWRRIFYLISTNTLGIYFLHFIFVQTFNQHVHKLGYLTDISVNIVYSIFILFISLISILAIRKIPLLNKLV